MLLLKYAPEASYKNVVDLLDETLINRVSRYAFVEIDQREIKLLNGKM